jgi:CheY-like chemotaxis protein
MSATAAVCVRIMGSRTPDAHSIDAHRFRRGPVRPLVLLVIDNDEVRARFAYQLAASGFEVAVTDVAAGLHHADPPDVIVAALDAGRPGCGSLVASFATDRHLRGTPVVAVASDASAATRDLARQEGCAAVCLTTCSGEALGAGLRAVLDRTD